MKTRKNYIILYDFIQIQVKVIFILNVIKLS